MVTVEYINWDTSVKIQSTAPKRQSLPIPLPMTRRYDARFHPRMEYGICIALIISFFRYGYYDGALYWITWRLTMVCGLISAHIAVRSFARQRIETQGSALKNQLLLDSYMSLKQRTK